MSHASAGPVDHRASLRRKVLLLLLLLATWPLRAHAHCDTFDGPVISDARRALEAGDPRPALKWVLPEYEDQVRRSFSETLTVRSQSPAARELADRWFFETLVRLHRQGEGFPFTGIEPPGTAVEPVILETDQALEMGSDEELTAQLTEALRHAIRQRFAETLEARSHAEESVEQGRRFVAAYVELTHYLEALDALIEGEGSHHGESHPPPAE